MREEQHAVAHLLDLDHVVRGPQHAAAPPGRRTRGSWRGCPRARGGIERGGRLVEQQQVRLVEHRLGQTDARLLAGGEHAALGVAKPFEVELLEHLVDALREFLHAVEQAEEAQILVHGQIAGQRRVDGGEVRPLQSLAAVPGDVQALDLDRSRRRLENAEDHVDGRGLARPVGSQQPDDLVAADLERDAVHGHGRTVASCTDSPAKAPLSPRAPHGPRFFSYHAQMIGQAVGSDNSGFASVRRPSRPVIEWRHGQGFEGQNAGRTARRWWSGWGRRNTWPATCSGSSIQRMGGRSPLSAR